MSLAAKDIKDLVSSEISKVQDSRVVEHIESLLVAPVRTMRTWDYGEANTQYPCWILFSHEDSSTGIAYCEQGFGPKYPWGLVKLKDTDSEPSIGYSGSWFQTFLSAYFDSFAVTDLKIWRVFLDDGNYPGTALSEEDDWDATWEIVYKLRKDNPNLKYDCHHSIKIEDK